MIVKLHDCELKDKTATKKHIEEAGLDPVIFADKIVVSVDDSHAMCVLATAVENDLKYAEACQKGCHN